MTADPRLAEHRDLWMQKPALRAIYTDYHRRLLAAMPAEGPYLEIGAGSGHMRASGAPVISLDILAAPWLDVVGDAHSLPFANSQFGGIMLLDVLHHLASPEVFFAEACRVLRPGGRLAMIEPGITPVSWLFYNFLHQEPVDLSVDPLVAPPSDVARDPFTANQAIPTLLFARSRDRRRFQTRFPELTIRKRAWASLFAYPLSGGFKRWTLVPGAAVPPLLALETAVMPLLGPLMAFRLAIVLERT